jgi:translation elongation factor EF-Tu-like GTPase
MLLHLSTVDDVFELSGRGSVVVVPGIPRTGDWRVKVGDPITLERPDGSKLESTVTGIEMLSPPNPDCIPLLVGRGLTKHDVPIGTKLWLADRNG